MAQSDSTIRFAETPSQFLQRVYQPQAKRSTTQQAFVWYFSTAISGTAATAIWYHSHAIRNACGHYILRWVVPITVATSLIADTVVKHYSRRAYQGIDCYDRNWRDLPTGVV